LFLLERRKQKADSFGSGEFVGQPKSETGPFQPLNRAFGTVSRKKVAVLKDA
jgi:hypothetical protein